MKEAILCIFVFFLPVVLTAIFIVLKLCEVIAWSWFFVWLPLLIAITIIFFAMLDS